MTVAQVVDIPIAEVTLLEDRAHVVRRGRVSVVRGTPRVRVAGVAPVLVDKTVGAHVLAVAAPGRDGSVRAVDAQVLRRRVVAPEDRPEAVRELDETREVIERELATLADRRSVLEDELGAIDAVALSTAREITEDVAWSRGDAGEWSAQLDLIDERERALLGELRAIRFAERDVRARLERLDVRRVAASTPAAHEHAEIEVALLADEDAEIELQIDYLVPGACWRPYHSARLVGDGSGDGGRARIEVRTDGCVWQSTGEDWTDVALRFSTQRPSLGTTPPLLADDRLAVQRKSSEVVVEAREQEITTTGLGTETVAMPVVPGIDDGGEVVSLRAPQRATVPSDGAPCRVELFRFESEAETELVVAAELAPAVLLRTVQINRAAQPLLAGPVDLIRDAGLAGRTSVLYIAPGERFELGWGPDPALRVHRRDERLEDETRMLSSWTTQRHKVTVRLSNIGDASRTVQVKERVPVSEIDKVQVAVHSEDTTSRARPDGDGFLAWTVTLAPFGHGSVTLRYDVKKHDDVRGL
jgi:uncharacterized protein (TIGR02231 family)